MEINYLNKIIDKYNLGGLVEAVKWKVKDSILTIDFVSPNSDFIGNITANNFELRNSDFCIFSTTKLVKILSVFKDNVNLTLEGDEVLKSYNILYIKNKNLKSKFTLCDEHIINLPSASVVDQEYTFSIPLTKTFTDLFNKTRNALKDTEKFTISARFNKEQQQSQLYFTVGDTVDYADNIEIEGEIPLVDAISFDPIPFNVDNFNNILQSNKNAEQMLLELAVEGLIKLTFVEGNITSSYYLVRLES